jgi:hypothetical protein
MAGAEQAGGNQIGRLLFPLPTRNPSVSFRPIQVIDGTSACLAGGAKADRGLPPKSAVSRSAPFVRFGYSSQVG